MIRRTDRIPVSSAVDLEKPPGETPASAPRRKGDVGRALIRGVGQTLITIGLVALLFVVYELWVTDLFAAREQNHLSQEIHQQWADAPTVQPAPAQPAQPAAPFTPSAIDVSVGQPFAVLHIPRLAGGDGFSRVVVRSEEHTSE